MFDYNKGWFTKALATNVPFLSGLIPFFYYLNMVTGLVAAFFIINDLAYKKIPQVTEDTKFLKRDMVILVSFYSFFAFTLWLDKYLRYKMPIQNNSSISNTNENSQTTKQQEQLPTTTQQVQAPINTQYEQIQNTQHQNADEAFYIICAYSVKTESQAKIKVAELKNDGYTSAYLWIPDYPSLSGAQFYSVYIGPFTTQYDCEVATEEYRKKYPKAYGLLVSNEKK